MHSKKRYNDKNLLKVERNSRKTKARTRKIIANKKTR